MSCPVEVCTLGSWTICDLTINSLGGALAQLVAYKIHRRGVMSYLGMPAVNSAGDFYYSGEGSTKLPFVITFGSPCCVGNL